MTSRLFALAGVFLLAGCASLPTGPDPLPSFIPETSASAAPASDSVGGFSALEREALRVRVRTCTEYATGTAFAIDEHHAITNRHVAAGATTIELTSYDGKTYTGSAMVLSRTADLALITIKDTFPNIATFADAEPAPGDVLTIAGYPRGEALAVTSGAYIATVPDDLGANDDDVYQIAAESHHGNSGSPVGADNGDVVGVLYASDDVHTSYSVALPTVQDFLADPGKAKKIIENC